MWTALGQRNKLQRCGAPEIRRHQPQGIASRTVAIRLVGRRGQRSGASAARCGSLQRDAYYLLRVDDAGARMAAYCSFWASKPWVWDLFSAILPPMSELRLPRFRRSGGSARRLERPEHNVDAGLGVRTAVLELADGGLGAERRWPRSCRAGRSRRRTAPSFTVMPPSAFDGMRGVDVEHIADRQVGLAASESARGEARRLHESSPLGALDAVGSSDQLRGMEKQF